MRKLVATLVILTSAAVVGACDAAKDPGDFGAAKPTTNDGMVSKPGEVPAAPPDFANALAVAPAYDKATGKLTVSLDIKPGFHAYAAGEEVGKPVELAVDDKNGWKLEGAPTVPAGTKKDLGTLGTSVILEGKVDLTATVKGGTGDIAGVVTAQVCTDKACDRPKQHTFTVPVPAT
jgi:hypothetical protein